MNTLLFHNMRNAISKRIHSCTGDSSSGKKNALRMSPKKKVTFILFLILFMLISQMFASSIMASAEDDIPDVNFGAQEGLHDTIADKDLRAETLSESLDERMVSSTFNATTQIISETEVYSYHDLPDMKEETIDPFPENVTIDTITPITPIYPRIFDLAEHSHINETSSLWDTIVEGQDNYWIHTDYYTPEGGRISKWTEGSLLPKLDDLNQGIRMTEWNGVNVDNDITTGDIDHHVIDWLAGAFPDGSDIYVRLSITIPDLERIFSQIDGITDIFGIWNAANEIWDTFLNGTNLEFEGGLKIEIMKDSWWSGVELPVDVGIVKGIAYEDIENEAIEYIWIGDFNFTDVPQFYEFQILLGTVSIYMGEAVDLEAMYNLIAGLISGDNNATYNFADFAPPYTVNVRIDGDRDDEDAFDEDGIEGLEILVGYDKLHKTQDEHRLVDRTYIKADLTVAEGETIIPKNFHVKLHGAKNPVTERTNYDALEWYSRIPVNVSAIYSEGKQNDTYVLANVVHLPYERLSDAPIDEMSYTSLRITLTNLTTEDENFTRIEYDSTEKIPEIELWGFEYDGGYSVNHQYNSTYAHVRDIPTDILLEGNFQLKEAEDPFTIFNNASISFIDGIIDDAMLALASTIYGLGNMIRSMPDALSDVTSAGGVIKMEMTDKNSGEMDYLGMAEVAVAYGYVNSNSLKHARYARSSLPNHDYFTTYIDEGISGVDDKVALGLRFSGIGGAYYEGIQDDSGEIADIHVELDTDTTFYRDRSGTLLQFAYDDPRMDILYLTGNGDDFYGKDFAKISLKNLPNHVEITLEENITTYDASSTRNNYKNIDYLSYQSLIDGHYMEFRIDHIPAYIQFINNDTMLSVTTIQFPEGSPPSEKLKPHYYQRNTEYMDLEFLITNETRGGKFVKRTMPSNYITMYKNQDMPTLNGSIGVASVSGRFKGLKSLYYSSDEENAVAWVEIRIMNPDQENLVIRSMDESQYPNDNTKGLIGSAIIGPIPEYMYMEFERVEPKKEVKEPDTSNISGFSDLSTLMDSVKELGRSVVDMLLSTMDDTFKGVGMSEETDYWMEYSMHDPILGTSTNIDVIINVTHGDADEMYGRHTEWSRAYWTRGLTMRQDIIDKENEKAIYDIRAYITGLPSEGYLAWNATGDYFTFTAEVKDFRPKYQWLVIDAKGIGDTDLLIHIQGLESPMEMDFLYESVINSTEGTIDGRIRSTITSNDAPIQLGNFYASIWNNGTDYSRIQMDIPNVPSTVDLSLFLNDSIDVEYEGSEGMDYIFMNMKIGDVSDLDDPAFWTHGIVIRNGTDEDDERFMDMRMYIEGVPEKATIRVNTEDDNTRVIMELTNWDPDNPWVLLDLKGLNENDIMLYQDLIVATLLDMNFDLDLTAPNEGDEIIALAKYRASRDLGATYLKFRSTGIENPVILQLYLPEVPEDIDAEIQIKDGVYSSFSASKPIDHMFARIHRYIDWEWYYLTLMLHDIPTYLEASLSPNKDFDPGKSAILQGNPNIEFKCSETGLDVFLDMDGRVNNAFGHTHLQAGDLSNNTKLTLKEPDVYSIDSPEGVGFAYLVLSDLPVQKSFFIEELYIYAEDVKSVDIHIRQLFGLYPVFKLSNADGGRIHVKAQQRVVVGDDTLTVKAGLLDVRYRTLPILAPLFVNHVSTTLSTNHYIIPELVTTVILTLWIVFKGLFVIVPNGKVIW